MLVNKRRKASRRRKGVMPAGLKRYWAGKRAAPKRRRVTVRHAILANPRKRRTVRRRTYKGGAPGFLSAGMIKVAGYAALGCAVPTLITDTLLPKVGLNLTGYVRRAAQFAVPTAVLMLGGGKFLGAGLAPFVAGAYGITALGLFNDVTSGMSLGLSAHVPRANLSGHIGAYTPAANLR